MPTGPRAALERFIADLTASVTLRTDVVGLVLVGSAAQLERADEWSDCDFFLVTEDGAQEAYRTDLSWLPDASRLVLAVRETAHGLKAVYDDGMVAEFAVFSPEELWLAQVNTSRVAVDRGRVADTVTVLAGRPRASVVVDPVREAGMFVSLLLIGVGRARRGEVLAAGQHIRSHALGHLLTLLRLGLGPASVQRLDDLDPFRRVELVAPALAAEITRALESDPESCARSLLALAEREVGGGRDGWPADAAAAVRRRLGW